MRLLMKLPLVMSVALVLSLGQASAQPPDLDPPGAPPAPAKKVDAPPEQPPSLPDPEPPAKPAKKVDAPPPEEPPTTLPEPPPPTKPTAPPTKDAGKMTKPAAPTAPKQPIAVTPTRPTPAILSVLVPTNATVWVEDQQMMQTGAQRSFQSPPLEPGKTYAYTLKLRWPTVAGQPDFVTQQEVLVRAGQTTSVDFTPLMGVANGTPTNQTPVTTEQPKKRSIIPIRYGDR